MGDGISLATLPVFKVVEAFRAKFVPTLMPKRFAVVRSVLQPTFPTLLGSTFTFHPTRNHGKLKGDCTVLFLVSVHGNGVPTLFQRC
jgi:hypothetical protein